MKLSSCIQYSSGLQGSQRPISGIYSATPIIESGTTANYTAEDTNSFKSPIHKLQSNSTAVLQQANSNSQVTKQELSPQKSQSSNAFKFSTPQKSRVMSYSYTIGSQTRNRLNESFANDGNFEGTNRGGAQYIQLIDKDYNTMKSSGVFNQGKKVKNQLTPFRRKITIMQYNKMGGGGFIELSLKVMNEIQKNDFVNIWLQQESTNLSASQNSQMRINSSCQFDSPTKENEFYEREGKLSYSGFISRSPNKMMAGSRIVDTPTSTRAQQDSARRESTQKRESYRLLGESRCYEIQNDQTKFSNQIEKEGPSFPASTSVVINSSNESAGVGAASVSASTSNSSVIPKSNMSKEIDQYKKDLEIFQSKLGEYSEHLRKVGKPKSGSTENGFSVSGFATKSKTIGERYPYVSGFKEKSTPVKAIVENNVGNKKTETDLFKSISIDPILDLSLNGIEITALTSVKSSSSSNNGEVSELNSEIKQNTSALNKTNQFSELSLSAFQERREKRAMSYQSNQVIMRKVESAGENQKVVGSLKLATQLTNQVVSDISKCDDSSKSVVTDIANSLGTPKSISQRSFCSDSQKSEKQAVDVVSRPEVMTNEQSKAKAGVKNEGYLGEKIAAAKRINLKDIELYNKRIEEITKKYAHLHSKIQPGSITHDTRIKEQTKEVSKVSSEIIDDLKINVKVEVEKSTEESEICLTPKFKRVEGIRYFASADQIPSFDPNLSFRERDDSYKQPVDTFRLIIKDSN